jgi:hypothetical protein
MTVELASPIRHPRHDQVSGHAAIRSWLRVAERHGGAGRFGSCGDQRHGLGMAVGVTRPLIFVDVDGVLIPLRACPTGADRPSCDHTRGIHDSVGNPLLDRLDPLDGRRLLALPGDLVWATTWVADANEIIAPALGPAALPLIDWPDGDDVPERGVHWKTAALTRWAAGRAFVWLDDEVTDADRQWVAAHYRQPALLHSVDPHLGLTSTASRQYTMARPDRRSRLIRSADMPRSAR